MKQGIFLIQPDGKLVEMREQPYDSENLLQELLAQYPNLLGSSQETSDRKNSWLLIKREMGIPDQSNASNRWSLDHLFVDINAIPTLVEVKRSTDTRIRREVVGQMLDYAANAIIHWPVERIQSEYQATAEKQNQDPDSVLQEFLGNEIDPGSFWAKVKTNLQAGNIRLIFIADEIPKELRRIIEYLNEQMDPTEVLGIEIRQFVGKNVKSLVPEVIGQTLGAEVRKSSSGRKGRWDEASFFETIEKRGNQKESAFARMLYQWGISRGLRVDWGSGTSDGAFYLMFDHDGKSFYTFCVRMGWQKSYIQLQFAKLDGVFASIAKKRELASEIAKATGLLIPEKKLDKYPSIFLPQINEKQLEQLLSVFDWYLNELRKS